jgi:hypothetical protein
MYLNKSDLKVACGELLADFDGVLSWKWDKNFGAFMAEFSAESQDEVRSILERHFSQEWDIKSIRKAPDIVKTGAGEFGDIRSGQLLFTSGPEGNVLILAAWWPWGDGEVVSLRIASPAKESPDSEKTGIFQRFKGLFER